MLTPELSYTTTGREGERSARSEESTFGVSRENMVSFVQRGWL